MKQESQKIKPIRKIEGEINIPGDKSISHRAVMLSAIASGNTSIRNFLMAEDCIATINAFKNMGVSVDAGEIVKIKGRGLKGLKKPKTKLYLGNSGTSMRLLLGMLAGQGFEAILTGDESLSSRPMKRVTVPLRKMGARIEGKDDANFAPLEVHGGALQAIAYDSPIPSAQVKSAILLAGLYAKGATSVSEPMKSRDHTERMLKLFGADITLDGLKVSVNESQGLKARNIDVPGDISSAAFFIIAALLLDGSKITLRHVGVNETRTGIIDILRRMGGKIEVKIVRNDWEPIADITVSSGPLQGTTIAKEEIPRSIDELPALMIASTFAKGRTVIKGAGELRVKETDRIESMRSNLKKMGGDLLNEGDDIVIQGRDDLIGAELSSFGDHRTAMAMAIAALRASGDSTINDIACVSTSFPKFFDILKSISVTK